MFRISLIYNKYYIICFEIYGNILTIVLHYFSIAYKLPIVGKGINKKSMYITDTSRPLYKRQPSNNKLFLVFRPQVCTQQG